MSQNPEGENQASHGSHGDSQQYRLNPPLNSPFNTGRQSPPDASTNYYNNSDNDRLYAAASSSPEEATTTIPLQPTSYGYSSSIPVNSQPAYTQPLNEPARYTERAESIADSDAGTASETDDEFDWDRDDEVEEDEQGNVAKGKVRAKRGRRIWLWLMGLSVWFRSVSKRLHLRLSV